MAKKKENKQLPRFTIQMIKPLYQTVHSKAELAGLKMYELVNLLLIIGIREWSKKQSEDLKIELGHARFEQAATLAKNTAEKLKVNQAQLDAQK